MPDSQMKCKAGKLYFLLVCLFLCTACSREEAVFVAGQEARPVVTEAEQIVEDLQLDKVQPSEKSEESEKPEGPEKSEEPETSGKLNINTAYAQELMTLPGIGESRAAAIIEYRQSVGAFEEIEEIMNVKGIGDGIFQKISSLICVK